MEFLLFYGTLQFGAAMAFWTACVFLTFMIGYWCETEHGFASLFVTIGMVATYVSITKIRLDLNTWSAADYWSLGACFVCYLAIGAFWSLFSWRSLNVKNRNEYLKRKESFLQGDYSAVNQTAWEKRVDHDCYLQGFKEKLKTSNYKERISNWIAFWPASMLWRVVSDWIWNLIKRIRESLEFLYVKIADDVYKDVK